MIGMIYYEAHVLYSNLQYVRAVSFMLCGHIVDTVLYVLVHVESLRSTHFMETIE